MKTILVALHGILTNQTDPSWPDRMDAWMFTQDPEIKVLKKEYSAGPFPRWNCWIKDPLLARSLANELELFFTGAAPQTGPRPALWFVAHSNGAVIALLTARRLLERGIPIDGLILTGAAAEADVDKNGVLEWCTTSVPDSCPDCHVGEFEPMPWLGTAIAFASAADQVLGADSINFNNSKLAIWRWLWGKLIAPYGCLGRTGWMRKGQPFTWPPANPDQPTSARLRSRILTRWFDGGHGCYFAPENIQGTFAQIYADISGKS